MRFCLPRFPAQAQVGGNSKIPTVLYYDKQGNVRTVGAEAETEGIEREVEDKGWMRAEWYVEHFIWSDEKRDSLLYTLTSRFKLHLRPDYMTLTEDIPFLPKSKTAIDVFADYFRYLHCCTLKYISETHANGATLLSSLEEHTEFVITHPNGWEGLPQSHLRKAAARGGLVPEPNDPRIHFITEGEAALHFCMRNHLTSEAMKVNYLFLSIFLLLISITERWGGDGRRRRRWHRRLERL